MPNKRRSRQWLYDRVDGVTRDEEDDSRPCCFLCFPPPFLKLCPFLLEENCICTCLGRIGCCGPNDSWARSAVLKYALVLNVCGCLLTAFAALALSENEQILSLASYSSATLTSEPEGLLEDITLEVGLQAVAINNPNTFGERIVPFDQFCNLADRGLEEYVNLEDCDQCNEASVQFIIAIIVAAVTYLPTVATDILRMYGNFDVNCQKVWATLLSLVTLAGCVLTYYQYTYACLEIFYEGAISYNQQGQVVEPGSPDTVVVVTFDWAIGNGMICLFAGFGIKCVDLLCNCCIPTPTITRDRKEQEEYEQLCNEESGDESDSDSDES